MANFDQLKQSVAAVIKTNGAEEITGAIMQDVLLTIINSIAGGYMFGGVAQHSGNVGNPDYNVFYLAGSGAYTGYGGAITIEAGCYGVFRYNGTWTQEVVDIGVRLSGSIAEGETRGVTGDVINTALQTLFENVMNILDTLTFTYNTPSAQQATKAMIDVKMTPTGGSSHVFATLTLASATVAAAGLMSAEDKQKVDRMLTDFRSLSFSDTTATGDQATKIVQTLSATLGENPEAITTFTLLAATASAAGLMSAADKSYLDSLPAVLTGINGAISVNLARVLAMIGYYECSTAAGTAAKEVSASGYILTSGGCIRIKMNNANTADNVTLNINSTGAKALYYDGAQASSSNSWEAGDILEVFYDGTQYQCASGGGGKFATGEKVKETSITNEISANNNGLPKSSAVYNAFAPLRYSTYNDITSLAVQQSSGTQTQVYYNNSGNLTTTGYGSAYKLVLPEGTTKVKVSNALNSPYNARLVMFNGDTVVTVYKQADLTAEPFTISIPNNITALGINRDTRQPMFTVEQVEDHVGVDGSIIADNSVTKSKLAADVKEDLMSTDSEKYALLQAVNNNAYPLRETILQYPVSQYTTAFPSANAAWGAEKYDYPIEIIGFRIWSLSAQSASVYIYNTTSLSKVIEKTASLSVGENVVMLDSPYVLKNGDIACVTANFAGFFDNNQKQVGLYKIDLSTGVLTPSPRNAYAFTVIYRGAEYPQSSSILYTKDFTEEENNGDFKETSSGTIVETSSGMTLANNNYIYLNRMYASNKTIRIQCLLYSTTVLKFGYRNNKTSQPDYVFTVDCANSKIKIGTTEEAFTVTNGGRYCIDIIKSSNIAILRVSDYKSCNVVSITKWTYVQDDLPIICLDSGTSPLIESYSVLSGVCDPYILFFGDSITSGAQTPMYHGQFLARFGDMIGKKTGKPYLVSGRAGSTITYITDEVVGRMFTEAKILRPKFVYVTIGTNGGNTEDNLTTLVKKLSDFGCKVILNNVPNRTYNGAEVDIAPTNDLLAQIRETFGLSGVKNDLACSVNNDGVTTNTALFGVAEAGYVIHPNGEGHYQMFLRTFIDCPEIYTQAGVLPVPDDVPSGTTSERPANTPAGFIYYDTTLGYHIWSNGDGGWVDKNGNNV